MIFSPIVLLFSFIICAESADICSYTWRECIPGVCIRFIGCSPDICTPTLGLCSMFPFLKSAQDAVNSLTDEVKTKTQSLAQLTAKKTKDLADLTAYGVTSGLNKLQDQLKTLKQLASINLAKVPTAFQYLLEPIIAFGKAMDNIFSRYFGKASDLGKELLDAVFQWMIMELTTPLFVEGCEECYGKMVAEKDIGFSVGVSTSPEIGFSIDFRKFSSFECFGRAQRRVRERLANAIPELLKSIESEVTGKKRSLKFTAAQIAAAKAIHELAVLANSSAPWREVNQDICKVSESFPDYSVPQFPSTNIGFLDDIGKATHDLTEVFARSGPLGSVTKAVGEGICDATNPKLWTKFFLKLEMMVSTFSAGVVSFVMKAVFPVIEKSQVALSSFVPIDFDRLDCSLSQNKGWCDLANKYTKKKLQCFQNELKNDKVGFSFAVEAGMYWFPPSYLGVNIAMKGMSVDFLQCIYDGPEGEVNTLTKLGGYGRFITVLINDILKINLLDFWFLTCPLQTDCGPGRINADTCICICPPTHVPSQYGCSPCPGITTDLLGNTVPCGGNGRCFAFDFQPKCCCNAGFNGTGCQEEIKS